MGKLRTVAGAFDSAERRRLGWLTAAVVGLPPCAGPLRNRFKALEGGQIP